MRRKNEKLELSDIFKEVSDELSKAAARPNLNGYKPHSKQIMFHSAEEKGRLYIGGNRSGKTVGGVVEDLWWVTGRHPYKRELPPPPVRGRIIGVDFDNGIKKILLPEVRRWVPPSALINGSWLDSYDAGARTLNFANGSFIEFMSYSQELDAFAGTSRHFIHFDEEPPFSVWQENRMRLIDTGGKWWITMTPVEGMTWVYDKVYERAQEDRFKDKIRVIQVDIEDNPYLSKAEIEEAISLLDDEEKEARKSGKFAPRTGRIFKNFDPEIHVIPPVVPDKSWHWCKSMDHGFNNPTAWLWHAVTPEGDVITFYEHYRREWTIRQHAAEVHRIEREILGKISDRTVGDPAIKQRQAINGNSVQKEYAINGLGIGLANNDKKIGVEQMVSYQRHGKWFITENCRNLIWEMKRYKWKEHVSRKVQERHGRYEEPEDKDNHALDASRYHFVSMPQLPDEVDERRTKEQIRAQIKKYLKPVTPHTVGPYNTDPFVDRLNNKSQDYLFGEIPESTSPVSGLTGAGEWTVQDEHLGGIW